MPKHSAPIHRPKSIADRKTAVWALTSTGLALAERLASLFADCRIRCPEKLCPEHPECAGFQRLTNEVARCFHAYDAHIFIMSTGIVVRAVAPLIRRKTTDPAVVVMDEGGRFAISLLAGHIGGANALAEFIARAMDATPVITTATDVHDIPAIDVVAVERGLMIETPEAIRHISMALLTNRPIWIFDPLATVRDLFQSMAGIRFIETAEVGSPGGIPEHTPGVFIHDRRVALPDKTLILRPPSLVAGMGCNRNTAMAEMRSFLESVLAEFGLSPASLSAIATIDIKQDEAGLRALAECLSVPLLFYDRTALEGAAAVPTPSAAVQRHVGVPSVCEAAAILASDNGPIIVPKKKTPNVTVAIARRTSIS